MLRACRPQAGSVHFEHLLLLLLLCSTAFVIRLHGDVHDVGVDCVLSRDGREAFNCISCVCGFSVQHDVAMK